MTMTVLYKYFSGSMDDQVGKHLVNPFKGKAEAALSTIWFALSLDLGLLLGLPKGLYITRSCTGGC